MSQAATKQEAGSQLLATIEQVEERVPHVNRRAFFFILDAIQRVVERKATPGHITGQELSYGILGLAQDRFGLLARAVLENWGWKTTADIGETVMAMCDAELMGKQESDRVEDFHDVFDFETAFDGYEIGLGIRRAQRAGRSSGGPAGGPAPSKS